MTGTGTPVSRATNEGLWGGAEEGARAIVPFALEVVAPRSVIDVGCGNGAWLSVFIEHGIGDVLGLDAPYVDDRVLQIPQDKFHAVDLRQPFSGPRRFDLTLSLEVAEHLPPARGPSFVQELVALAPVVLFSAAVPGQGGQGHINERWPEYWVALFEGHGYRLVDAVRRRFWDDPAVEPWYSQNAFFFVAEEHLPRTPRLAEEASHEPRMPLRAIHPRLFTYQITEALERPASVRTAVRSLGSALRSSLRNRLRRLRKPR